MADHEPEHSRLGEVLVTAGAVNESQLNLALKEQSRWDSPLGMTLVRMGFVDEDTLVRALASQLGLPVVSLRGKRINKEILELISIATAEKYRCLPLLLNSDGAKRVLYLGVEDPTDTAALEEISIEVGMAIQSVLVAPTELDESIHRHYHWASTGVAALDSSLKSGPAPIQKASRESQVLPSLAANDPFPAPSELDEEIGLDEFIDPKLGIELDTAPDAALDADPGTELRTDLEMEPEAERSILDSIDEPEDEIPEILEFAEPQPDVVQRHVVQPHVVQPEPAAVAETDPMLRAIAQLLIEKGIFTRDELVERLRTVSQEDS